MMLCSGCCERVGNRRYLKFESITLCVDWLHFLCREICRIAQHLRPQSLTTSHHFAPNHTQHPITTPSIAQLSPAAARNGGLSDHNSAPSILCPSHLCPQPHTIHHRCHPIATPSLVWQQPAMEGAATIIDLRRASARKRKARSRANETDGKHAVERSGSVSARHANKTDEKRKAVKIRERKRHAHRRANQTDVKRTAERIRKRENMACSRANQTDKKRAEIHTLPSVQQRVNDRRLRTEEICDNGDR